MKEIDNACINCTNVQYLKFEERKKKMIFHNPYRKNCLKIQVDGCAIKEGDKCDNLLKIDVKNGAEYYIELKGTDVGHALKQIEQTIIKLHNDDSPIKAYIIPTNQNPALSTKVQQYKSKLKKKYHADLTIKERICEETI